ncbi:MAG TPA: cytochrome c biogenesis protein CcsA [Verrucomicrobiota bacterium]|nr:cytochrome c biogenesis protein CcsA [Verrucomicrobiota bacterium]HNT14986.1 cytochrome c biogenesis protein CcsA [Verrucomicrobiota bacterium]
MKPILKIFPWLCLALFGLEMVMVMKPKADGEMHVAAFGRLPALLNGRVQPLDSVARNSLLQIRSTGDLPLEMVPAWQFWRHGRKLRSSEWLLEVCFQPEIADTRHIFLMHHPDLISELKLDGKGTEKSGLHYYSFHELESKLDEIMTQAAAAGRLDSSVRTTYQQQLLKLANALNIYQRLKNSLKPESVTNFVQYLADYQAAMPAGIQALRAQTVATAEARQARERFLKLARTAEAAANQSYPRVVPPAHPQEDRDGWMFVGTSLLDSIRDQKIAPAVTFYARMASAYAQRDSAEFNRAVAGYKNWLGSDFAKEVSKGRAEFYFNRTKLFLHATIIYIAAFVLAGAALLTLGSWPTVSESFRRSAFYLIALAFLVHTTGLIFRMALEGRPPVTNLYSSAIFIGWGACVLGLLLERIYKVGLGSAMAGLSGFLTLLIAHNLALGGDTMEMMRAVLDTNFWLAAHVVVVTLGYAATFFAGMLAIAYVVLGVFTPILAARKDFLLGKALVKMVYAIVCFATLFSFSGTVLGGIWADQSWGRFWGWDPKENGALLIVIWNVLILHARWGGLVRERGLMNLAIFGNIITAWSWFGTNMLGIGLHSYGFMDAAFKWLMLFVYSQLGLIALGLLPLDWWRSFRVKPNPALKPASGLTPG